MLQKYLAAAVPCGLVRLLGAPLALPQVGYLIDGYVILKFNNLRDTDFAEAPMNFASAAIPADSRGDIGEAGSVAIKFMSDATTFSSAHAITTEIERWARSTIEWGSALVKDYMRGHSHPDGGGEDGDALNRLVELIDSGSSAPEGGNVEEYLRAMMTEIKY